MTVVRDAVAVRVGRIKQPAIVVVANLGGFPSVNGRDGNGQDGGGHQRRKNAIRCIHCEIAPCGKAAERPKDRSANVGLRKWLEAWLRRYARRSPDAAA